MKVVSFRSILGNFLQLTFYDIPKFIWHILVYFLWKLGLFSYFRIWPFLKLLVSKFGVYFIFRNLATLVSETWTWSNLKSSQWRHWITSSLINESSESLEIGIDRDSSNLITVGIENDEKTFIPSGLSFNRHAQVVKDIWSMVAKLNKLNETNLAMWEFSKRLIFS